MSHAIRTRRALFGLMAVGVLALSACSPVVLKVDTPKTGDAITVAPKQELQVRWANLDPDVGAWTLEAPPAGALSAGSLTVQPAADGARQLEVFHFTGERQGTEQLVFSYKRKSGEAPSEDERISIRVTVK